jgi:hypothetical protein
MSNPIIRIHNALTNTVIDRNMTDVEFAKYETDKATEAARKAEIEAEEAAKATAKAALLTQLGITEEQAKLLLS